MKCDKCGCIFLEDYFDYCPDCGQAVEDIKIHNEMKQILEEEKGEEQ